jgi:hypothetical protein
LIVLREEARMSSGTGMVSCRWGDGRICPAWWNVSADKRMNVDAVTRARAAIWPGKCYGRTNECAVSGVVKARTPGTSRR